MMRTIVFATNNEHKLSEINNIIEKNYSDLKEKIKILSLKDINCNEDIPEKSSTLEGNASMKANYVFDKFGKNCFADDTGLDVEALNGRPGVLSARYAGENGTYDDIMNKVLEEMKNSKNRKARFRTVISLIIDGKETLFEGIVNGKILNEKHGSFGFGYDPIFQADGYNISFGEMSVEEKNTISHRFRAVQKLIKYLREL